MCRSGYDSLSLTHDANSADQFTWFRKEPSTTARRGEKTVRR